MLDGCTPEPLMSYLKAIGTLRLLSEQEDPEARGSWCNGVFKLETRLDRHELPKFFLENYSPTPLLAPWNGGSGFYVKLDLDRFLDSAGKVIEFKGREAVEAIDTIERSASQRLRKYREQIRETKRALAVLAERVDFRVTLAESLREWPHANTKAAKKKAKEDATKVLNTMLLFRSGESAFSIGKAAKDEFVSDLRGQVLTDDGLCWLDAALGIRTGQKKNRVESPILGSGGNIGNSDFSARFAGLLPEIIPLQSDGPIPSDSYAWLSAALFGTAAPGLEKLSVDQFDPGKAGGANGTQGMEGSPTLNPWDYVLMLEGVLALAGNTSRRLGAARAAATFPFVVESTPAGHGSIGNDSTRGEAWLPLWSAPTRFDEVKFLLSEGRAEVGRVRARSGLTFAQAVAGLGVDRGIASFVRYEFQERLGRSYIATPVGRFEVPKAPLDGIELVRALNEPLLSSLQAAIADGKAPARFPAAVRRIESAILDYCKYGKSGRAMWLAGILAALGNAERELAVGDMGPDKRRTWRPLGGLTSGWLKAANDGSPEFGLARGVAFLFPGIKGTGRVRRNLEAVEPAGKGWAWSEGGGHVVWNHRDVARNLGALLIRRLLDAEKSGEPLPPFGSPFPVALADIATFLVGGIDDTRFEELLWGISLVERDGESEEAQGRSDFELPRAYSLIKLTLLPRPVEWRKSPNGEPMLWLSRPGSEGEPAGVAVKPEPAAFARLRAADVQGACDVAARRLHSSGFSLIGAILGDGTRRSIDWSAAETQPERLLAALLFPIPDHAVNQLANLVLRLPPPEVLC
jgi:CRISPR-associated protein Csx17